MFMRVTWTHCISIWFGFIMVLMVLMAKYVLRDRYFMTHSWQLDKLNSLSVHSTVRTWDLNSEKKHKSVFKPRSFQGKKVTPTCCTYSRDGKLVAAGCQDGTIQIWDRNLSVSLTAHTHTNHHIVQWVVNIGCVFCYGPGYRVMRLRSSGHRSERSEFNKSLTLSRIQNAWLKNTFVQTWSSWEY